MGSSARAGFALEDLAAKFNKLSEWESGETRPPLKQLEAIARTVHVPFCYLFRTKLSEESVPIPDFRPMAGRCYLPYYFGKFRSYFFRLFRIISDRARPLGRPVSRCQQWGLIFADSSIATLFRAMTEVLVNIAVASG